MKEKISTRILNKIKTRKFTVILLVSFFLGFLGIDRYLLGYKNWWIKLVTFGGFYVWYFIDLINLAIGKLKMADGNDFE
jgi:hypothetical protein